MDILIIEKNQLLQDGWSAADCPRCSGVQPIRLEQVVRVVYFYCIRIGRDIVGRAQRCDYCEQPVENLLSIYQLSVEEWSHADGMMTLLSKLGLDNHRPADASGERCLKALLEAANEESASANIDVTGSTLLGGFLGGVLGAVLGGFLRKPLESQIPLDQLGFIFAGLLGGILLGCVIGAMIVSLGMPTRFAYQRLSRTVSDYRIDPLLLQSLAGPYSRRVRRAVRRLSESVGHGHS